MRTNRNDNSHASQRGLAILVVMAILAILVVLVMSNSRTLFLLKRELREVERQQLQRIKPALTNQTAQKLVVPPPSAKP